MSKNDNVPKHTSGPWKLGEIVNYNYGSKAISIDEEDHEELASVVYGLEDEDSSPQQEANAHLIAAAPDMLEALEETNNWLRHWLDDIAAGLTPTAESLIKLRAKNAVVITKARGVL